MGYTLRRDMAAVSLWVRADGETNARELANRALAEEMTQLGLI